MVKRQMKGEKKVCAYRRKAQSTTVAYTFVIALVVASALYMQNFLKRSAQGQLQAAGDQIGDQYGLGLTTGNERTESNTFYIQVRTAGLNNPTRITFTAGSYENKQTRSLRPLGEVWPNEETGN
jgi:hypothetical protein